MKASVIIPTYKRTNYLLETLKSVREQDFPSTDYEIVIVDNASQPMPELAVLHHLLSKPVVRYFHEPRNGLHHARHAGAMAAHGDFLVYIDDDVFCQSDWLRMMMAPYRNEEIGMIAGKVILKYEATPPPWLLQFQEILSAFDQGEFPHSLEPFTSPVGCNMSVRKPLLFAIGGFNPDGFGDRRLLRFRGDGESGLARKVHEAGWLIWYEPRAKVHHRVPFGRMSSAYVKWRAGLSGIETAYTSLRYQRLSDCQLFYRVLGCFAYCLYYKIRRAFHNNDINRRMYCMVAASRFFHRGLQHWRQLTSYKLKLYTKKNSYF
jgi:glycosyltransferase involved in cell wall biosynthesis